MTIPTFGPSRTLEEGPSGHGRQRTWTAGVG